MTDQPSGDGPTDLFLSLTPHKVLEAVEASGVLCNPVCYPLNSFENRVYEVECEDRTRLVAKFYRPGRWSRAQILEEHRFLAELEEAEIPVCATQPFPGGETLRPIVSPESSTRCAALPAAPTLWMRAASRPRRSASASSSSSGARPPVRRKRQ